MSVTQALIFALIVAILLSLLVYYIFKLTAISSAAFGFATAFILLNIVFPPGHLTGEDPGYPTLAYLFVEIVIPIAILLYIYFMAFRDKRIDMTVVNEFGF